ncbi:hypothetical protein BLNAU_15733 [Blattamonas nauphoetae]|uniref:Uncharacterized protein n=1 Tax=Blattamonas nauphoetae TaxID=2049346 RepID=A0ABQ9XDK2_9EUKA|nr:hypothetical protein BLNAU_15733 [Blattamonas nauphoetae]
MPVPPRLLSISVGEYTVALDFVELSSGSVALPNEATFTLTLESVHSDGTTPHQKVINLETDPSGQLKIHNAQLYPFETETEKKKGQLEYGTEYKVLSFKRGDTTIHFEDSTTRIQTPKEPARILRIEKRQLNTDRTRMIVLMEGRALVARTGKVSLTNGSTSWESLSDVTIVNDTHSKAEFGVGEEETSNQLKYGETYTLKGSWTESSGFHVEDGIAVKVPFPPKITKMEIVLVERRRGSCFVRLTGTDLEQGTSCELTLNPIVTLHVTFTSTTEGRSNEVSIGANGIVKYSSTYTIASLEPTNAEDGSILFDPSLSFTTGF